jgi:quinol monooxygenase YgiN
MITVIFRVKAKPGKEGEALAAFKGMVEKTEPSEPGTLGYVLHTLQGDPSEFVFFELYKDDEALKTHMGSAHMAAMRASFGDLFDTTSVKMERLERVAGFVR